MSTSYVPYHPEQQQLLPSVLQDWRPLGHLAYVINDMHVGGHVRPRSATLGSRGWLWRAENWSAAQTPKVTTDQTCYPKADTRTGSPTPAWNR